jgi:ankyrin repeat protein
LPLWQHVWFVSTKDRRMSGKEAKPTTSDAALMALVRVIAEGDDPAAVRMIAGSPTLASASFAQGATRQAAKPFFLRGVGRYLYAGDTALHVAAAGYRHEIVRRLIAAGADLRARNRLGAEPLHAAAVGTPGSPSWNPGAQAETIACLVEAGADPNAMDKIGVTALHRAVRTRCAAAVRALIVAGADVHCRNRNGTTPMGLAWRNTGRGGTGLPEAKAQQQEIVRLLERYGATLR